MTHTRASVIKRVEDEYRALDKVVKRLLPADFRRPAMRADAPIRFTVKDVLAHITAWKWRQVRVVTKDQGPLKAYEPPKTTNIRDTNAGIYRRSYRTPATSSWPSIASLTGRCSRRCALRPEYFANQRSAQWPFDAVGHVEEHRRKHFEPLVAANAGRSPRGRAAR